jgi:acetolactate synthase-1/2/3 large subunit
MRTGGRILADQLALHGADLAFCVAGESYLTLLDALLDTPVRVVGCRHEAAAANAADAYGKLTGRPGLCLVTRGPGATHASAGVHTAFQDSTPLILLIGQVPRDQRGREAFQEVDYAAMFTPLAKWVHEIDRADRIPEILARAFATAVSGRPGPVVLALPEDLLDEQTDAADARPFVRVQATAGDGDLHRLRACLVAAERPLLLVGGGDWTAAAGRDVQAFAEANGLPVAASFRAQDVVDNTGPAYVGHVGVALDPRLAARVRTADLIIAAGPRLGSATTRGYTLLAVPTPTQSLVHAHPDPDEIGRVYQPELGIVTGMPELAAGLRALAPVDGGRWAGWLADARRDYLEDVVPVPHDGPGVDLGLAVAAVRDRLGPEAIITVGAGNYTFWAHRYYRWRAHGTLLGPTSGSMGYGLPAAIAAKLVHPERDVVAFAGDGCFLMQSHELATLAAEELAIVIVVVNNGVLGTIRMHQERRFPGRVQATDLVNPDFAALARAYGAHGERVERTEDFAAAFDRALGAGRAALVEVVTDPRRLSPR